MSKDHMMSITNMANNDKHPASKWKNSKLELHEERLELKKRNMEEMNVLREENGRTPN